MLQAQSWKGSDWILYDFVVKHFPKASFFQRQVFGWCFFIIENATFLCRFQGPFWVWYAEKPRSPGDDSTRSTLGGCEAKTLQPLGADFQGKNFFQPWAVGVANLGPQKTWPIFLGAELAMASVVWSQTYNRTCINCNKGWNPQFSTLWFFRRTGRVCIFQADKHETYTSATVNRQFMAAKLPYFPRQGHGVELPI